MTTPDTPPGAPSPEPVPTPTHESEPASTGWGTPTYGQPGYGQPPASGGTGDGQDPTAAQPRYGQYAPHPPAPAWQGQPHDGNGQYGQPQYGQAQYGHPGGTPAAPFGAAPYAAAAAKPGIVPLRPLTLGEIYDGGFGAIRHNPRVMLGLSVLVMGIATLVGIGLGYLLSGVFASILADLGTVDSGLPPGTEPTMDGFLANLFSSLGSALALLLATPILNGLLIASVGQSVIGRKLTAGQLWAQVRSRVWPLLGFTLLSGIAGALAVVVAVALVALAATVNPGLAVLVGFVLFFALVVGLVWFAVRTLLIPPALVLEGQRLWPTIGRAWRLTRGSFWRLLGISLLAAFAVGVVGMIIEYPLTLVGNAVYTASGSTAALIAVTALGSLLSGILQTVFMAGVVALLYIDVRMRREGLDVELTAAASEQRAL